MMKEMNEFGMMLEGYMDGFDEGKDDDVVAENLTKKAKHKSKNVVLTRRKKGHWKSVSRMNELTSKASLEMTHKDKDVVAGMLRSHQVSAIHYPENGHHFNVSVANKKRNDAAALKLKEVI